MSASMMTDDHADVAIKPPLLFLGALALGCLLSLIVPIGPRLASPNGNALAVGLTFVALGFALAALSARAFRRAGTDVVPGRPASTLVTTGPYRITRNPIYIGMTLVYFGLSIVMTSIWVLLLLVPVLMILQQGVVLPEEAYLKRRFGAAYRKYQAHVPRWL
ncbi:MAG TPA: isoprenylcysteine carboxylmethyltransferase family protein [Methyloceanibacter sp.]|nr:isoprenylcysteine carboxylmethyltransferase family protein [Methyloceanibacter sp.]